MSDAIANFRRAPWSEHLKMLGTLVAIGGAIAAAAGTLVALGRKDAAVAKIDHMEATQNQMLVDSARTKLQVDLGTATIQKVEMKVDDGFRDQRAQNEKINDVLMQLRLNGRR